MVLNDNCKSDDACGKSVSFGKAEYALICVGIEGILILIFTALYMGKNEFNIDFVFLTVLSLVMRECCVICILRR